MYTKIQQPGEGRRKEENLWKTPSFRTERRRVGRHAATQHCQKYVYSYERRGGGGAEGLIGTEKKHIESRDPTSKDPGQDIILLEEAT